MAIVGFRFSHSTNQEAIGAAKAATDRTVDAARDTNKATIDAAHADVRRTLDATRGGQIADLNSRAIDQLGSNTLDVRIGGIYALERVARDSASDHPTVMEVLGAFIREHSREQWPKPTTDERGADVLNHTTRPDVQAALTVIGRRDRQRDKWPIDLTSANLVRANLIGADLTRANLTGADMKAANLTDAHLAGAHLTGADLTGADLTGADLTGADMKAANLTHATLVRVHLEKADVRRATLIRARLTAATFSGAILHGADFTEAYLADADLVGAYVTGGQIPGVGRVAGPNLTGASLAGAKWQKGTPTPEGWRRDPGSGLLEQVNIGTDDAR